jgi:uncharacterized protein (DUF697 family)
MLFVPERRRSRPLRSAIRARDVRAADLQEDPTKPNRERADPPRESLRRIGRRGGSPANIAASAASDQTQRARRAEQSAHQSGRGRGCPGVAVCRLRPTATYAGDRAVPSGQLIVFGESDPRSRVFGGLMASAQEVRQRIATVISPVANLVTAQGAGGALRQVIEIAIDGYGRMPSAKALAARHLQRQGGSVDEAITAIIDHHIRLASAQGFVTNIGGLAALPVAIPANITGVTIVQVRMVAAIAHLRGYDLNDHRVRTALVMCLMGGEQVAKHIAEGTLPTSPMTVATAPVFDPDLDRQVADEVVTDLAARIGGKNVALAIVKRLPLMGGGVSAIMDGFATYQIGRYATGELLRRRALVRT